MKKILTLIALTGLLCSCQTDEKELYSRSIDVVSIPEGAPIIVDGLKIGTAPLSIGVETNEDGYFVRKTVITAIPQKESLHTQIITFPEYLASNPEKSRVPEKITFYMEKPPSQGDGVAVEYE
jgi:hypothetical protein